MLHVLLLCQDERVRRRVGTEVWLADGDRLNFCKRSLGEGLLFKHGLGAQIEDGVLAKAVIVQGFHLLGVSPVSGWFRDGARSRVHYLLF